MNDLKRAYLQAKQLEGLAPNTISEYDAKISRFVNSTDTEIHEVTTEMLREYLATLSAHKTSTISVHITILKSWFNWLVENGELEKNPMGKIPKPKAIENYPFVLSVDDVKLLIRAAGKNARDKAIVMLLVDTGLRASELCGIHLGDVDQEGRSIVVRNGKGGKPRIVFYGEDAQVALLSWLSKRSTESSYLFPSTRREKLDKDSLRLILKRLGEKAGISSEKRVSPHTLRHTFATFYAASGGGSHALQVLLGHADTRMAERYVNLAGQEIKDLYNRHSPLAFMKGGV